MNLPILFQDDDLVVIHKPSGLLVHRSDIDRGAQEFAMQILRDQIGQLVYPVHRLDRATSGALIFALSPESAKAMAQQFERGEVDKKYLAVVRGVPPDSTTLDYPLKEILDRKSDRMARTDKPAQSAITRIHCLATHEFPVAVDKYPTSRYSLVRAEPQTGRKHQIRRHLRHLGHPVIGDVTYGTGKHNRFFQNELSIRRLLLACTAMSFRHPKSNQNLTIRCPLAEDFAALARRLGWGEHLE